MAVSVKYAGNSRLFSEADVCWCPVPQHLCPFTHSLFWQVIRKEQKIKPEDFSPQPEENLAHPFHCV